MQQLAFAGDGVCQIESCEFKLLGQRLREKSALGQTRQNPVVERAMILKLQRANRVRYIFDGIRHRVRVVVHRINAPLVASTMMMRVADTVNRRIAHVHVGRGHVNFGAQNMLTIFECTCLHFSEQIKRLFSRPVAKARVLSGFAEATPISGHLLGALAIDVGVSGTHQPLGHFVHQIEMIASKILMLILCIAPREAKPLDTVDDGVDILLLFPSRVGVIKAQMTTPAIVAR